MPGATLTVHFLNLLLEPQQRLQQYDTAHRACEQAITLYDQLDVLLDLLRDALHICSPHGKLRTPEGVRAELTRLFDMIAERDGAAITQTLKPIRHHIDDILLPFKQAEAIAAELRLVVPHEALDFLVLAWHQDHLSSQSGSKHKRSHQRERDFWLACADALLDEAFDTLKTLVFDKLDSIIRASSLVEMVNSLLRPSLNSCKGHITQETLNLIMFSHNHRRYKSGTRQGKAPIELLTGKPLEAPWWEPLRQQINTKRGVTAPGTGLSRPPPYLVVNNDGCTDRQAVASGQTIVDSIDATENDCRHKDSEAASSFHLCSKPHCELGSKGWIGPTFSHDRHVTRQTVNYFRPVLKGADHGSDFTSTRLEQVAADLHCQLVYSTVGRPQGRGKVERLFGTLHTECLAALPGYLRHGKPATPPRLSLPELNTTLGDYFLGTYNNRSAS